MKKFLILLLLPLLFVQCKNKKTKLTDDDTVEVQDFVDFFPDVKLPYEVSESLLDRKETDSASIGYKIFTQFVPDTVITKQFGKNVKPQLYPLGKAVLKKSETYLFVKAVSPSKKVGYILALDKQNKFIAAMPLVVSDKDPSTAQAASMDVKYAITITKQRKKSDGNAEENKNVYILNSDAGRFMLILTDAGIPQEKQDIINPIDTFPRRNKYAGDYIKDKRNYVSIRDGRNMSQLLFFTHFEKENGECVGELKGTATINGARTAIYRATGNPCVLEFSFGANTVSMKEVDACGSYRDIKCFFDGSYTKKKESKPKKTGRKR
jgi:hypothetical protein